MTAFADRLAQAMKTKNIKQARLAEAGLGSKGTISNWYSGKTMPDAEAVGKIASFLGVSTHWLSTGQGQMTTKPSLAELQAQMDAIIAKDHPKRDVLDVACPIPVISWVAAGSWTDSGEGLTVQDCLETLPRPNNLSKDGFALIVRGESMLPEFRPDEYIYVEPQVGFLDLKNGDLVVVREANNNEATFKQLVLGETSKEMYLRPLNPNWHEQKMIPKDDWELVGRVVGKWVKY